MDILDLESLQLLPEVYMETGRWSFPPILLNNNIYLFGGLNGSALNSCEWYNFVQPKSLALASSNRFVFSLSLETMTMKPLQPMRCNRYSHAATIMDGKIYVAGGKASKDSYLCSVECYDPAEDKWTEVSSMNHPRANFGLVELNGKLYAVGHHESIEQYDPVEDTWISVRRKLNFTFSIEIVAMPCCSLSVKMSLFLCFIQVGSFKGSEFVMKALNLRDEIYVMGNRRFGKLSIQPECSFLPLRDVTYSPGRGWFID